MYTLFDLCQEWGWEIWCFCGLVIILSLYIFQPKCHDATMRRFAFGVTARCLEKWVIWHLDLLPLLSFKLYLTPCLAIPLLQYLFIPCPPLLVLFPLFPALLHFSLFLLLLANDWCYWGETPTLKSNLCVLACLFPWDISRIYLSNLIDFLKV